MYFEAETSTTLDDSVPIIVRHLSKEDGRYDEEEYIFQFALNKEEILDLQKELKHALKILRQEEVLYRKHKMRYKKVKGRMIRGKYIRPHLERNNTR